MSEDRTWLKSFMEMHLEIQEALKAKNELDEIKLLLKELDVGQVPGYQPLSAIQGIRKLHGAWMQLSQCEVANVKTAVDFMQKNEALRAENAKLRAYAEQLELQCSALREELVNRGAIIKDMRREYGALREEYANRGAIIQDFAKREHELQQKIAELEKILRDVEGLGSLTTATALQWKANYEHQMAVNARLRSRIAELRKQLKRIEVESVGGTATMAVMAHMALDADDRSMDRPITQEAQ